MVGSDRRTVRTRWSPIPDSVHAHWDEWNEPGVRRIPTRIAWDELEAVTASQSKFNHKSPFFGFELICTL